MCLIELSQLGKNRPRLTLQVIAYRFMMFVESNRRCFQNKLFRAL
jgi:hypothetical protein